MTVCRGCNEEVRWAVLYVDGKPKPGPFTRRESGRFVLVDVAPGIWRAELASLFADGMRWAAHGEVCRAGVSKGVRAARRKVREGVGE